MEERESVDWCVFLVFFFFFLYADLFCAAAHIFHPSSVIVHSDTFTFLYLTS